MKLLALGLFSVGLIVFAFCFWAFPNFHRSDPFFVLRPKSNYTSGPNSDYWIYPGDETLHFYNKIKGETSVQGKRSVDNLKVNVIVLGPTGTNANTLSPFRVYENIPAGLLEPNDAWGEEMRLKKTDITESSINVDVKIESMPKDEDLWGRNARLVVSGKLTFPHKTNDKEYIEKTLLLREETPFRFASRAEKEKYEAGYKEYQREKEKVDAYNARYYTIYRITKPLTYLVSAVLVVSAIWIFFRSMR